MSRPLRPLLGLALALTLPTACTMNAGTAVEVEDTPAARWDHRPEATEWTEATLAAISTKGTALTRTPLPDITEFCPAYPQADQEQRSAFWVGIFSAIAKHESTWNPRATGGGGRYLGLLQISPATARAYGCDPSQLHDGEANLTCAVKIAARQVERTGVLVGGSGNWGGLAADWGPMRNAKKRQEIASWTRQQDYCRI